jgi:hypothetical protein
MVAATHKLIRLACVSAGMLLGLSALPAHSQESEASQFVTIHYTGQCDKDNKRAYVLNTNKDKTVLANVSWHLAGGKRILTNSFRLPPGADIEVGCAGEAKLLSAVFDE